MENRTMLPVTKYNNNISMDIPNYTQNIYSIYLSSYYPLWDLKMTYCNILKFKYKDET